MTTLLDTGPLVALLSKRDKNHAWAVAILDGIHHDIHTCDAVFCEAYHILKKERGGVQRLKNVFRRRPDWRFSFSMQDEREAVLDLMDTYADLPMDFADACLTRQYQQFHDGRILTSDSDFTIYRDADGNPLRLLAPWQ